jgi:hypothetical protein
MALAGGSSRRKTASLASLLVLCCLCLVTRAASQESSDVAVPQGASSGHRHTHHRPAHAALAISDSSSGNSSGTSIVVTSEAVDLKPQVVTPKIQHHSAAGPVISDAELAAAASPEPEAGSNSTDLTGLEGLYADDSGKPDQTIAQVIDNALAKEFDQETAKAESEKGKTYNATVASDEVGKTLGSYSGWGSCLCLNSCQLWLARCAT